MIAPDPRAFAAHKLWVSKRVDREPVKRRSDLAQAKAVVRLTASHFDHLPYKANAIRLFPRQFSKMPSMGMSKALYPYLMAVKS